MRNKSLEQFLQGNHVTYKTLEHSPAYTAQEIAAAAHIPGKTMVKTVIVKLNGKLGMLVGPANWMFDLELLRKQLNLNTLELASEYEFQDRFKDCEIGAMPPFGNLYDMPVLVDESLLKGHDIAFNAGNHFELVQMSYEDWAKLVKPKLVHLH